MTDTRELTPLTLVPDLLDAAQAYDARTIVDLLSRSRQAFGLGSTVDDVLLPTLRLVGRLWQSGRVDVAEEHLASAATLTWLGQVAASTPPPTREGRVLLACGPRDLHSISLQCMAVLLAERGVDCCNLGAQTPTASVLTAVQEIAPAAVVVVSHSMNTRAHAVTTITGVAATGTDVYYAGGAFSTQRSRAGLPGRWLGLRLTEAADELVASSLGGDGGPQPD